MEEVYRQIQQVRERLRSECIQLRQELATLELKAQRRKNGGNRLLRRETIYSFGRQEAHNQKKEQGDDPKTTSRLPHLHQRSSKLQFERPRQQHEQKEHRMRFPGNFSEDATGGFNPERAEIKDTKKDMERCRERIERCERGVEIADRLLEKLKSVQGTLPPEHDLENRTSQHFLRQVSAFQDRAVALLSTLLDGKETEDGTKTQDQRERSSRKPYGFSVHRSTERSRQEQLVHQTTDSKPSGPDSKPSCSESKPSCSESKPSCSESKPSCEESRLPPLEIGPSRLSLRQGKPSRADSRPSRRVRLENRPSGQERVDSLFARVQHAFNKNMRGTQKALKQLEPEEVRKARQIKEKEARQEEEHRMQFLQALKEKMAREEGMQQGSRPQEVRQ